MYLQQVVAVGWLVWRIAQLLGTGAQHGQQVVEAGEPRVTESVDEVAFIEERAVHTIFTVYGAVHLRVLDKKWILGRHSCQIPFCLFFIGFRRLRVNVNFFLW